MTVIIISAILVVICIIIGALNGGFDIDSEFLYGLSLIVGIISALVLIIAIVVIPVNRYCDNLHIASIEATRQTIAEQRSKNIDAIERAKLTETIISENNWLAQTKYANSHSNDIYHPDSIEKVEPLK